MNRELDPAELLPAIQSVAGGLVVSLVLAESARTAAEHELAGALAELARRDAAAPMPANGAHAAPEWPYAAAGEPAGK